MRGFGPTAGRIRSAYDEGAIGPRMWPIGHVAGAYLLFGLYQRWQLGARPGELTVLILVGGSLLPDLLDKPLAWYVGVLPTGRSLSHSLLLIVPLCAVVAVYTYRMDRSEWGVAFAIGALSHLLLDALPALWRTDASADFLLYPVLPVEPYENGAPTITELLRNSLMDPYFHLEFVFLAGALVLWRSHGYPGVSYARSVPERLR